eukprot:TRINITY_DN1970_c0_g1_i1.p4 TRINITY_DN1970_c0_g1~~TRINITY_DN1970_c0_g1_i1.p4  ORF type:complete len:106 (-),score=37.95 TRINITY_DN1970_c0_g1_i1:473-790(-)
MGSLMPGSLDDMKNKPSDDFVDKDEEHQGEDAKKDHAGDHVPWWIKGTKDEKRIVDLDHKLHEEQEKKDEAAHRHHHKEEDKKEDLKEDHKIESEHVYTPPSSAQ